MTPQIDLEKCVPIINRLTYWASLNDAELRLHCGEMTAQEIRTVRAVLTAILPKPEEKPRRDNETNTCKKRPRLSGFDRMTNALEIVRNHNEDVEQWIAQHIGNLRDERERMTEEISRLKRRVSRLEKRTSPNTGSQTQPPTTKQLRP